jgi:hypothetical protein
MTSLAALGASATATTAAAGAVVLVAGWAAWWFGAAAPARRACRCPWSRPEGPLSAVVAARVLRYHACCSEDCPARRAARAALADEEESDSAAVDSATLWMASTQHPRGPD